MLRRLLRTIEHSEWSENTVVGLLKLMVNLKNTRTNTLSPQTTRSDHGPRSRVFIPDPRLLECNSEGERSQEESDLRALAACARWDFQDPELGAEQEPSYHQEFPPRGTPVFIVIGLFEGPYMVPKGCVVYIERSRRLFWNLRWEQSAFEGFAISSA